MYTRLLLHEHALNPFVYNVAPSRPGISLSASSSSSLCGLPGCSRLKWMENGRTYDFCGRTHRDEAKTRTHRDEAKTRTHRDEAKKRTHRDEAKKRGGVNGQ